MDNGLIIGVISGIALTGVGFCIPHLVPKIKRTYAKIICFIGAFVLLGCFVYACIAPSNNGSTTNNSISASTAIPIGCDNLWKNVTIKNAKVGVQAEGKPPCIDTMQLENVGTAFQTKRQEPSTQK